MTSALTPFIIIPLKALFSISWLIFLIAGAVPLQQMRQMNKILKTPLNTAFWGIYISYILVALIFFAIGMVNLWLV